MLQTRDTHIWIIVFTPVDLSQAQLFSPYKPGCQKSRREAKPGASYFPRKPRGARVFFGLWVLFLIPVRISWQEASVPLFVPITACLRMLNPVHGLNLELL